VTSQVAATKFAAVFDSLDAAKTYQAQVVAINAAGRSAVATSPSAVAPLSTLPVTTASAPQSLAYINPAKGNVSVSWVAPANTGGKAITGYNSRYSSNGGKTWSAWVYSYGTSHVFTDMKAGTQYTVQVQSLTSAGAGAIASLTLTPVK
jgi:hypothetical protein